eukprot:21497-Chlamydomonas_euryale.AAC.5
MSAHTMCGSGAVSPWHAWLLNMPMVVRKQMTLKEQPGTCAWCAWCAWASSQGPVPVWVLFRARPYSNLCEKTCMDQWFNTCDKAHQQDACGSMPYMGLHICWALCRHAGTAWQHAKAMGRVSFPRCWAVIRRKLQPPMTVTIGQQKEGL